MQANAMQGYTAAVAQGHIDQKHHANSTDCASKATLRSVKGCVQPTAQSVYCTWCRLRPHRNFGKGFVCQQHQQECTFAPDVATYASPPRGDASYLRGRNAVHSLILQVRPAEQWVQ